MNKIFIKLLSLVLIFLAVNNIRSQGIPSYYFRYNFLYAPPSIFQEGLMGFVNPANLKMLHKFESRFFWNTDGTKTLSVNDWGIFSGFNPLGFGINRIHYNKDDIVTDYRLSAALGASDIAFGIGYGWTTGSLASMGWENLLTSGLIIRPWPYLSLGIVGNWSLESNAKEGIGEIGIRPFGTPKITLFADAAIQKNQKITNALWSLGAITEIFKGINLIGRVFDNEAFTLGLTIDFGRSGIGSQFHFDHQNNHNKKSNLVRLGSMRPSTINTLLQKGRRYFSMELKGKVVYQKFTLFDKNKYRLLDILRDIEAAKRDPRISVLVLNMSASRILPEYAWEIRGALQEFRESGKKVLVYIDYANLTQYYLASVADMLVIDPEGYILMPGLVMGRTYFKGTLEKFGLGFDEWRYFKYKSAAEILSRQNMSEADREQTQNYLNDWYETWRSDICRNRNISQKRFDELIDDEMLLVGSSAVDVGLVDTMARWSDLEKLTKGLANKKVHQISSSNIYDHALTSSKWGKKPEIALVYGLGVCALDEGIKARRLEKIFFKLKKKKSVKAVVFRVDSPGGDGLASDMVANAVKQCSQEKPVIVSQGQVAGSGGYHISIYGDQIVAGPNTITGSIGVIGGWIYDRGISDKLGISSDFVKRGAHAEVGFGAGYFGLRIPKRNLSPEEKDKVKKAIFYYYDRFKDQVAQGRGISLRKVEAIAEGQFFSGLAGKRNGLVDEIGGLLTAISLAKELAGIHAKTEIRLTEIPKNLGIINLQPLVEPVNFKMKQDIIFQYLKMYSIYPGRPLPMMLPGTYPTYDDY